MTTKLFNEWLKTFNSQMQAQVRKVLLLMDNASVHNGFDKSSLKPLMLCSFPPTLSLLPNPKRTSSKHSSLTTAPNSTHISCILHSQECNGYQPDKGYSCGSSEPGLKSYQTISRNSNRCFAKRGFKNGVQGPAEFNEPLVTMEPEAVILQAEGWEKFWHSLQRYHRETDAASSRECN